MKCRIIRSVRMTWTRVLNVVALLVLAFLFVPAPNIASAAVTPGAREVDVVLGRPLVSSYSPATVLNSVAAQSVAAVSCYGGSQHFEAYLRIGSTVKIGPFTASKRCRDINLWFSTNPFPTKVTAVRCRDGKQFTTKKTFHDTGKWHIVAKNVKDGTCFYLKFAPTITNYSIAGKVAS